MFEDARAGDDLLLPLPMDEVRKRDWLGQEYLPAISAEARRFRLERVAAVIEGRTPLQLRPGLHTVLHILPNRDLETCGHFEATLSALHKSGHLRPVFSSSAFAFSCDSSGCLIHNGLTVFDSVGSYLRIFRNGALESVNTLPRFGSSSSPKQVPSLDFELRLLAAIPRYFSVLEILGVRPAVILGLSLIGAAGYSMEIPAIARPSCAKGKLIGDDTMFLPEVVADDLAQDPGQLLRPIFDAIWKTAGWEGSIFYDASEWLGLPKASP